MDKTATKGPAGLIIRPLRENDLKEAGRIMHVAFGTFEGVPDPAADMGDTDFARTRWTANPEAAFCADLDGQVIGSIFATHWGSVGFFGPLTVRPDFWDQNVGQMLIKPVMELFAQWQTTQTGLYTYAQSPKHAALYQKFGFWPRYLTAIMSKPVRPQAQAAGWSRFSELPPGERSSCLQACREMTASVYPGLDLGSEIRAVADQKLGDTLLLWEGDLLAGLAVCHAGAGTEAGSGACYVKCGAVRSGPAAQQTFANLLGACESMAAVLGAARLTAGVNTARQPAYLTMLEYGFRTTTQGVAMLQLGEPGTLQPHIFMIDDWR